MFPPSSRGSSGKRGCPGSTSVRMLNGELCAYERRLPRTECSSWRGGKREEAWSCWVRGHRVGVSLCVMGKGALGCLLLSPWWGSCIIGMMREGIVLAM
jgi:hypothetical protein